MDAGCARKNARFWSQLLRASSTLLAMRKAVGKEQTRYLLFLFFARHRGNDGGEILRGEVLFAAAFDGDADGVYLRIENIGAMRRGIHPGNVQRRDVGSFGDVFRDQPEACAGHAQTSLQIGFAVETVRKRVVIGKKSGVQARGVGQGGVPLQLPQA